jgi:hypothetical protein
MQVRVGDVLRMRTWDDNRSGMKFSYGLGKQRKDKKTVALMLFLGESPIGADFIDEQCQLIATMHALGWERKTQELLPREEPTE